MFSKPSDIESAVEKVGVNTAAALQCLLLSDCGGLAVGLTERELAAVNKRTAALSWPWRQSPTNTE